MNDENEYAGKKNPKLPTRKHAVRPLAIHKATPKSNNSSNTPNFGRISPQNVVSKVQISKQSLDYLFDDSLNFSDISERDNLKKEILKPDPPQNYSERLPKSSHPPTNNPEINPKLSSHIEKYDKAFSILQQNFSAYRDETERRISNLQEDLAVVRNSLKCQTNLKTKISNLIDSQISHTKFELQSQFTNFLSTIEKPATDRPPKTQITMDRIHKIREEYDSKLAENEKYINSLKKNNEISRSRSSSRECADLVRENKTLREELSNLWNNQ